MTKKLTLLLAALPLILAQPSFVPKSAAAEVGSFSATCEAPNWLTGDIETVTERNVYGRADQPVMGFTHRLPGGHWLIEYNYDRIMQWGLADDVLIFVFYHECAHAQHNSENEGVADCAGLAQMNAAGEIREGTIERIRKVYAAVGRQFPSGDC